MEHGPQGRPAVFDAPSAVISAYGLAEVMPALARAEAARAAGAWIAGYIAYEAGYALEPRLADMAPDSDPQQPLLLLGIYSGPQPAEALLADMAQAAADVALTPPEPMLSRERYGAAIAQVLDYIAAGDCYQVNLTFPLLAQLRSGTALGLYGALRRTGPVGHGAYVDLGEGPILVSRSPELFFSLDAQGGILARPMKGTRPRHEDAAQDAALALELQLSPKDRAENLMIVDLLRNDISRIAKIGSLRVPKLFAVEHYTTVHQMTSTIQAELAEPAALPALVQALFPCGSITGAPKIRAMQIIRGLEPHARHAYCGAIGWMGPDGAADFSVAIRTLSIRGDQVTLNVGGGVVQDSTAQAEWEEALWKARFVMAAVRPA